VVERALQVPEYGIFVIGILITLTAVKSSMVGNGAAVLLKFVLDREINRISVY